jgi:hypothetical protein
VLLISTNLASYSAAIARSSALAGSSPIPCANRRHRAIISRMNASSNRRAEHAVSPIAHASFGNRSTAFLLASSIARKH